MMDKYSLDSDPCDYRLIRINNCLQLLACLCNIVAIFVKEVRSLSRSVSRLISYHDSSITTSESFINLPTAALSTA
jgi:hypothetical protein